MVGRGAAEAKLSGDELREIVGQALQVVPRNSRVLAIIPDKTRDDNTDILFPFAAEVLQTRRVAVFDALVAQGTHAAMTTEEKRMKIGGRDKPLARCFGQVFDHHWDIASELTTLEELDARKVSELTDGLLNRPITLTANKLLRPDVYDTILIFGATVPHEVAGFAGGAKYFFPGVSGAELTHATHWLGALHGVEKITLASQVDKRMCERVRLGYMNPHDFNLRDYQNDDETLIVERAGRDLYLVAPHEDLPRV